MLFTYRQIKHRTSRASRGRRQHSALYPYNYGSFSTVPNQLNIFPSLLSVHSISSVSSVSLSGLTVRRPAQCVERRSPLSHPCGRTATRAPTCSGTDAFLKPCDILRSNVGDTLVFSLFVQRFEIIFREGWERG